MSYQLLERPFIVSKAEERKLASLDSVLTSPLLKLFDARRSTHLAEFRMLDLEPRSIHTYLSIRHYTGTNVRVNNIKRLC